MTKGQKGAFAVCLAAAALAVCYLTYSYAVQGRSEAAYSAMQQSNSQPASEAASIPEATKAPDIPIDFASLQKENPDIYAWIEITGTDVAYPILQHPTDDSYYLQYNLDGSKGYPGCIYTERCDAKDFSDFNTVLYGHNMKNGSMFGSLKKYRDADYLQQHREIVIYTPTQKRVYRVFAAVVYGDTYLPVKYDDSDTQDRQAFLNSLSETHDINSQVLDDVDVTSDSQILTLSTCIGGRPNNRYLIEAVYVGDE